MQAPLTDREWWLMCRVQRGTLMAVVETCEATGLPGKVVAAGMLKISLGDSDQVLRLMIEDLLQCYEAVKKEAAP